MRQSIPTTCDRTRRPVRRSAPLIVALALALAASACGTDPDTIDAGAGATDTTSVAPATTVEVDTTEPVAQADDGTADGEDAAASGDKTTTAPDTAGRVRLGESVLAAALEPGAVASSARFALTMEMTGSFDGGEAQTMSVAMEGAYDLAASAASVSMDLSGMMAAMAGSDPSMAGMDAMFAEPMRVITIGDQGWMQGGFTSMLGLEPGQWLSMSAADVGTATQGFGPGLSADPTETLRRLQDADAVIEELGTEVVRGVETTHIRATVDLGALAAQLSPDDAAAVAQTFGSLDVAALPMDFWLDADGLIRRWSTSMDMAGVAGTDDAMSMRMVYEIFDYGQDVGIVAPDPAMVVSGDSMGF